MQAQHCFISLAAVLILSAALPGAASGRMLMASESPTSSDTINSILSKGIKVLTFGQNTEIPPPILQGATDLASFDTPFQPSNGYSTQSSTILFQCRAVGNQIYTANASTGQYANTAAHADLWCGPGTAKVAIKHFFSDVSTKTEAFTGGKPSFEAVDGSGLAVGAKVDTTAASGQRNGDGGFGSVGDVLLQTSGQGTFSDVTWIIRNNELGGQIAPGYSPLAASSTDLENFAPTGAEGVPNAPVFIPYQADYTFFTGARPNFPQPGVVRGSSGSSGSKAASG
uniref:Putative extracellular protein TR9_072 n=1 Tax=Trebouxia lynnae TaxID=1825957 RepID=A0A7L9QEI8_9CHLO|nr:putative extracellular protein TR9_072 [Trebouxia lynnae]